MEVVEAGTPVDGVELGPLGEDGTELGAFVVVGFEAGTPVDGTEVVDGKLDPLGENVGEAARFEPGCCDSCCKKRLMAVALRTSTGDVENPNTSPKILLKLAGSSLTRNVDNEKKSVPPPLVVMVGHQP